MDFENCSNKKLIAPYKPKYGDNFDKNYCLQNNKIGTETMERYEKIMNKENIHLSFKLFNGEKIPEELNGYIKNKANDNLFVNNNISSIMSTTSISRNNKIQNKQDNNMINMIYYNEMNKENKLLNMLEIQMKMPYFDVKKFIVENGLLVILLNDCENEENELNDNICKYEW